MRYNSQTQWTAMVAVSAQVNVINPLKKDWNRFHMLRNPDHLFGAGSNMADIQERVAAQGA
jgi:hypothetical protein